MAEQLDRFRSFTERYIIERATHFEIGREQEQAWLALQDAKKIYGMIAEAANPVPEQFAAGGVAQAPPSSGPPWTQPNRAARNAAIVAKMPSPVAPPTPPTIGELIGRLMVAAKPKGQGHGTP